MSDVLPRKEGNSERHTGRRPQDDRGGDWSDASTSQGTLSMARNTRNEGECLEQILLQSLQKECGSADTSISDSGPQNCERTDFHCSKAPRL